MKIIFWFLIFLIFYSYIGYGILLFFLVKIKKLFRRSSNFHFENENYEPEVTLFVTAFNEKDFADKKVKNSLSLNYPKEKLKQIWITDGSNDGTPEILKKYKEVILYHKDERAGKMAAMNRGMKFVKTPIVIFSDANTILGKNSIKEIINLFKDEKIGCVSGEKRIFSKEKDNASGAGEGIYWKYESTLKKWDFELYSVVGAAGELFAIRTELFEEVEKDTLLDDFIISLRIAKKGYKIGYNPEAYAIESASLDVKEELKRKIRISAGGIQAIIRLKSLLNPFKYGILSFQYISHRVLRWTLTPIALLLIIPINFYLAFQSGFNELNLYNFLFYSQIIFYFFALIAWFLENKKIKFKILFIPYYFFIMNLSVYLGFFRFLKGKQSVKWERAKRAK